MDGDICPLDELTALAEEYNAMVMVDDCHGEEFWRWWERYRGPLQITRKRTLKSAFLKSTLCSRWNPVEKKSLENMHQSFSFLAVIWFTTTWCCCGTKGRCRGIDGRARISRKALENTEYFRSEMQSLVLTQVFQPPLLFLKCV